MLYSACADMSISERLLMCYRLLTSFVGVSWFLPRNSTTGHQFTGKFTGSPPRDGLYRPLSLIVCHCEEMTYKMADRVGFEPTVPLKGTLDFESSAFNHSATCPVKA